MQELPRALFDVYALALPHGHGFGRRPPISAWQSEDGFAFGVVTRHVDLCDFGILAMRRRVDHVWAVTAEEVGFPSQTEARAKLVPLLKGGAPLEQMPPNTAPRPPLHDVGMRDPSEIFRILTTPSHHIAAWLLNQLYLSLPNPDKNWAGDCQTSNTNGPSR